jgi:hypothetical protein
MDVESLAKQLILQNMTPEQQTAVLDSIKASVLQAKDVQKQRIGENVQVVVQTLKKLEADIKARYDETGKAIEKRVASIKDGRDGRNGVDGRPGKDGRPGRDGVDGPRGADGLNGSNGIDGQDGISITDAHIDFDGSLIITLSDGKLLNVGEVVSQDIAEKIKVIQTMSTNGAVGISDEGSSISTGVKNINFVGAAVTASASGDEVTVNVSSGTGTVTSVAVSGGSTGLTTSGGPITTTGTITLGGTLAVASGGTGTATPGLVAGTNITSITGSWPNQTINASGGSGTVTSVAATGGTGISVSGSPITTSGTLTITNTAPDQTVALTQGGTTTITGTYPNFTISSADQFVGTVTSVTGTSPVVSSGGATPAISLASGYGDTLNPYASKTANFVLAAPDGTAGVPTFRAVVAADIPTLNQSTTGSAATLTTGRTIAITGDLAYTSPSFDGSGNVTAAGTLATVNSNVGSFTNASITVNSKGLITAASNGTAGGTVTSVAATVPSFLSISGSPITTSGTLAIGLSGTALPVANGGTGVTTSTGSGNNVLSTSPTLVTPNIDSAQFATVSGTAPIYPCRAWVNFNGTANTNLTGTYSRTSPSTTLTVTATAHGLLVGSSVNLDFTTGTALDGVYTVVTVADANTFTITTVASTTTSGNVTLLRNTIRGSGNVSSVTDNGTGDYTVNFATAMPDANYAVQFTANRTTGTNNSDGFKFPIAYEATSVRVVTRGIGADAVGGAADAENCFVSIFR